MRWSGILAEKTGLREMISSDIHNRTGGRRCRNFGVLRNAEAEGRRRSYFSTRHDQLLTTTVGLFVLVLILGGFGIYSGYVKWSELVWLLILGPVCCVAAIMLTTAEKRIKKMPLEDEALREDFDHVLKRWSSSMLPDW